MTHHLNWTRIGKSLRASALDAHDGALPPVDLAYSFLSGNPECFIDSNEWPADMPTIPPSELIAAYYGLTEVLA